VGLADVVSGHVRALCGSGPHRRRGDASERVLFERKAHGGGRSGDRVADVAEILVQTAERGERFGFEDIFDGELDIGDPEAACEDAGQVTSCGAEQAPARLPELALPPELSTSAWRVSPTQCSEQPRQARARRRSSDRNA
jgi:hypothetical protein